MKRKIDSNNISENKVQRMSDSLAMQRTNLPSIQLEGIEDIVKDTELMNETQNRRTFQYNMNDKAAKGKLLKGAKKEAFEVVKNQASCNLDFNPGSWNHVVLPTLEYWNQIKGGKSCIIESLVIKVASVKTGKDGIGKHIDTQIIFLANRDKIVCHFYNTTQRVLVNGHGYMTLVEKFLIPYFEYKIPLYEAQIIEYNDFVLDTLGSKKVKRSDIKFKRGSTFS